MEDEIIICPSMRDDDDFIITSLFNTESILSEK